MRRTTTRHQATVALKAIGLGSLLALTISAGVGASVAPQPAPHTLALDSYAGVDAHAISEHRCSTTDLDPRTQPEAALVRTPRGALEVVPFDEGWQVFTGDRPGLLVALCLGEEPRRP